VARGALTVPRVLLLALALAACGGGEPVQRPPAQEARAELAPRAPADTLLLAEAVNRGAALPRLTGMLVAQDGRVVAEGFWRGGRADRPTNVKSVSKSVLSALVGIAIAEGRLRGPDQPLAEILPEHFGAGTDPRKRSITLGHLVSMRAGLESTSFQNYGAWVGSRDWVRDALRRPLEAGPGERMIYSTGNTHLLSAALTRATGTSTWAYAVRALGEPLGIRIPRWQRDPQGIYFGGNDMYLTPRALLRFGELYRNGGVHEGKQIVPRAWVEASARPLGTSRWSGFDYGYGWWTKRSGAHDVFFAWGYGGQYVFVVPSLKLTAVFTSLSEGPRERDHLPAIHAILDDQLIPGAEARLQAR
jgi:CubicO group peptidase (beta-lactamase class C family)